MAAQKEFCSRDSFTQEPIQMQTVPLYTVLHRSRLTTVFHSVALFTISAAVAELRLISESVRSPQTACVFGRAPGLGDSSVPVALPPDQPPCWKDIAYGGGGADSSLS